MKKVYQSASWLRHSRAQQRRAAHRAKLRKRRQKHRNRLRYALRGAEPAQNRFDDHFVTIIAPEVFSFIENPEALLACMSNMHQVARQRKSVFLDLANIKVLSCDAITLLLSNISNPKFMLGHRCTGNVPNEPALAAVLKQSGFYSHVRSANRGASADQDTIFRRRGKKVELKYVEKILTFATTLVYGNKTKVGGVYRALIECMANTRDHASDVAKQHEAWWTSVYFDEERGVACFSFLDNGVGVFKSRKIMSLMDKLVRVFGAQPNTRILREILEGKLASSTGLPYRGKGLPSIFRAMNRGQLARLTIITNDVYAAVSQGNYRYLKPSFRGTFLYWELRKPSL